MNIALSLALSGVANSIGRCFCFNRLARLRRFLPRIFLLFRDNGLKVGDSSSSSTTMRRLRSFDMLGVNAVVGVVGIAKLTDADEFSSSFTCDDVGVNASGISDSFDANRQFETSIAESIFGSVGDDDTLGPSRKKSICFENSNE